MLYLWIEYYCLETLTFHRAPLVPSCMRVDKSRALLRLHGVQGSAGIRTHHYRLPDRPRGVEDISFKGKRCDCRPQQYGKATAVPVEFCNTLRVRGPTQQPSLDSFDIHISPDRPGWET